jgi:uncharacterized membrane protein
MNPPVKPESESPTPASGPAAHPTPAADPQQAAKPAGAAGKPRRRQPSDRTLKLLSVLVGLVVLAAGLIFLYVEDVPIFAIPLVVTLPVIAAVAFRNCWD